MTPCRKSSAPLHRRAATFTALTALLLAHASGVAGPGAHGPNGEHLDAPAAAPSGPALPRLEAHTEAFELVATLNPAELSVLIDRYDSNEPVLGAALEVESGDLKAKAVFHADQGDYAFEDPALLARLRTPGEHALVFTLVAGADSDLLDGTLVNAAAANGATAGGHAHDDDDHAHDHGLERAAWIGGGLALLAGLAGASWWRQRRNGQPGQHGHQGQRGAKPLQGGL